MDVSEALAALTEISAQIEAAVVALQSGDVVGSTIADEERAGRFARSAADLLAAAKGSPEQGLPVQLEVVLGDASVFVVREGDRLIAAVTGPDPTVGLVFYDLKSCLRSAAAAEEPAAEAPAADAPAAEAAEPPPAPEPPKRPRRRKKAEETDPEEDVDGAA